MNIQGLYTSLQAFENQSGKTLTIPATSVPTWTDVHGLLVAALANDTLTITAINNFPSAPSANAIRYTGQASLFPWTGTPADQTILSVTATFSVDNNGAPQLFISAEITAASLPWTLTSSLDGLTNTNAAPVSFESGSFYLTSQAQNIATYPVTLEPYINFAGMIAITGPYASAGPMLANEASRSVYGAIDLTTGPAPALTFSPTGSAPSDLSNQLGGATLSFGASISLKYETIPYFDSSDPQKTSIVSPFSSCDLVGQLIIAKNPVLNMSLPLLPASDFQTLTVTSADLSFATWAALDLLTGYDLGSMIPSGIPGVNGLVLKNLSFDFEFIDENTLPLFHSMNLDVALQTDNWPILPNDILTLSEIGITLSVQLETGADSQASGSLYGQFTFVDEMQLESAIYLPRQELVTQLVPGTSVSVADVMASIMDKLTGHSYRPPIEMDIDRLIMSVSVPERTFGLEADISTDWSIAFGDANGGSLITLSFDGISFEVLYDGEHMQGTLSAFASIQEAQFYFSASSPGDGAGWGFAGGLVAGNSLSVTNLLTSFMYPGGAIPGGDYGIPNLMIDQLEATLATDESNNPKEFSFTGGMSLAWTFKVYDNPSSPDLTLSCTLKLHGTMGDAAAGLANELITRYRPGEDGRAIQIRQENLEGTGATDDWVISGSVEGTFSLFGLQISAGYLFDPTNSALTFGIWYKSRGLQATVTQRTVGSSQEKETILTVRLGDLSLGEILEYLIGMALPGETRRLSAPWDILYQINFKNLSLIVNLTTSDVEVDYQLDLDLVFARFDRIGLEYKSVNGEGRVYIKLYGEFLGQSYGGDDDEPLAWDVLNEDAPDVPGKGPQLLDLRYVALGQHISLSIPVRDIKSVETAITAMRAAMKPVSGKGNPLTDPNAASLRYDGNSNWMFGLDATILDTVSLSAVMFDPTIYGALITVAGERGGALDGLRFELLYRKITEEIGEFSVDLRIPDMFRHLEFGEVSVTLGMIHVDIYTNGNFNLDLGFPHNQDFTVSFAVEVFPFVGRGGFYFASLTGATADRVPTINNGEFNPVIQAGFGLSVGLGKDFQAGPLKAGLTLEVFGILEGIYAPFNPYNDTTKSDTYYWIQGTVGIVGKLYGSVDFVIIKASVSLTAKASITFTLEAHKASLVELRMSVTARASVKIIFVTVHFSFDLRIEESFTIGSNTSTPWIEGTNSDRIAPAAFYALSARTDIDFLNPLSPPAYLRQQRRQRPMRRTSRLRHARRHFDGLLKTPEYRSNHQASKFALRDCHVESLLAFDLDIGPTPWPPIPVFGTGTPKTARLQFLPFFTIADPSTLAAPVSATDQPEPDCARICRGEYHSADRTQPRRDCTKSYRTPSCAGRKWRSGFCRNGRSILSLGRCRRGFKDRL